MAECGEGYDENKTFLSGDILYHQCVAKEVPDGYQANPCGEGYEQTGMFISGEITYYSCEEQITDEDTG